MSKHVVTLRRVAVYECVEYADVVVDVDDPDDASQVAKEIEREGGLSFERDQFGETHTVRVGDARAIDVIPYRK